MEPENVAKVRHLSLSWVKIQPVLAFWPDLIKIRFNIMIHLLLDLLSGLFLSEDYGVLGCDFR